MTYVHAIATVLLSLALTARAQPESYLETVIVTAKHNSAAIADINRSVTHVDQDALKRLNAEHANQLFQNSPGTWVSRGDGQESLTAIRSPVFTGAGACAAFLMSEDGIPLRASGFCNANQLFDSHFEAAERVEIIRGPNAAYDGSNALFGAINVLLPTADRGPNQITVSSGSFDFYRLNARISSTQTALFATLTDDNTERDQAGYQQQKLSLRHQQKLGSFSAHSGISLSHLNQRTAGYIEGKDAYKNDAVRNQNLNPDAYRNAQSLRLFSRLHWEWQHHSLTLTPYLRSNRMDFLMHFLPWQPVEENGHQSAGIMAQWHTRVSNSLALTLGSEFEMTQGWLRETQFSLAPFSPEQFPQGVHYDYAVDAATAAAYASLDWRVNARLNIGFNLRNDSIRYDYTTHTDSGGACEPSIPNCRFFRPDDRSDHFQHLTTSINGRFEWAPLQQVFASTANGFRAPQATELYRLQQGQIQADLKPVRLLSRELGLRGELGDGFYQVALYNMDLSDGIFQNNERQNVSGANTHHSGLEYELGYHIHPQWLVRASGSLARHTYSNNPNLLGSNELLKGNEIDTAPQQTHALVVSWLASDRINADAEWVSMGSYFLDPQNNYHYPGHTLSNLRLTLRGDGDWEARIALLNAMNSRYAERADVAFGEERYFPGQSRKLILSLSYTY